MRKTFVWVKTWQHFDGWCQGAGRSPYEKNLFPIVTDDPHVVDQIKGVEIGDRDEVIHVDPYLDGRYVRDAWVAWEVAKACG